MILGITGKIASGKSEVMRVLEKMGFYCIYADKIVHELYKSGGEGTKKICEVFGDDFLDAMGEVDRIKLRNLVFTDNEKLDLLNKTIHPLVYKQIAHVLEAGNNINVAIESVYFDVRVMEDYVDRIFWIERSGKDIIEALINNRNFSKELAEKAEALIQKPDGTEFIISNSGTLQDLESRISVEVVTLPSGL